MILCSTEYKRKFTVLSRFKDRMIYTESNYSYYYDIMKNHDVLLTESSKLETTRRPTRI
jgi:hypothetical protein